MRNLQHFRPELSSSSVFIGKGIADQDRNILSHQVLLLDFLRSAAQMLTPGPMPASYTAGKRKTNADSDDEDRRDPVDEDSLPMDVQCRGTVLVTLRNVPPYTLW